MIHPRATTGFFDDIFMPILPVAFFSGEPGDKTFACQ
jgi:hypothetical protein